MNTEDHLKDFEAELKNLKPAGLPEPLMARLRDLPAPHASVKQARTAVARRGSTAWETFLSNLRLWERWLVPATALLMAALVVWRVSVPSVTKDVPGTHSTAEQPGLLADSVEVDRQLVGAFDAIAELPGGEPVRFQCEEWIDEFTVRDQESGLTVQKRVPRLEVVAVSYETY